LKIAAAVYTLHIHYVFTIFKLPEHMQTPDSFTLPLTLAFGPDIIVFAHRTFAPGSCSKVDVPRRNPMHSSGGKIMLSTMVL
jgi:hypothetical protein